MDNEYNEYTKSDTPLHLAVLSGETEIVKIILDKVGCVNDRNEYGKTPLHCAVDQEEKKISELLLQHGANVNALDSLGITPLQSAVMSRNSQLVELLLRHGADFNYCMCHEEEYTYTPLYYAIETDNKEILTLLLSLGADVNCQSIDGTTMLHAATKIGDAKFVKMFLEYNVNVNLEDNEGKTPLHICAERGYDDICIMLLNKHANVNAKQKDGNTALHLAIDKGCTKIVNILLECGANVDLKNENGLTPLHLAVQNDLGWIVKWILNSGADIDVKDKQGRTALHIASQYEHVKIVKILLYYGSDINITCNDNKTALNYAKNQYKNPIPYYNHDEFDNVTVETLIQRHIVQLEAANLHINKQLFPTSYDHDFIDFQNMCKCEIARIKSDKIMNTTISVYDILAKEINSLATYMLNENIVQVLQSSDYKTKYPLYGKMIQTNISKGWRRKTLLEQCNQIFHLLFGNLPNTCIANIYSYLDNDNLHVVLESCYVDLTSVNLNLALVSKELKTCSLSDIESNIKNEMQILNDKYRLKISADDT